MSFSILSSASKCSKYTIRDSRTLVKTRVKVDELKILEYTGYYCRILFLYCFFDFTFLFCFFKNFYVYEYGVRDSLSAFNMKKNYSLKNAT